MKRVIFVIIIALIGSTLILTKHSLMKKTSLADSPVQNEQLSTQQSDVRYFKRFLNLHRIQFVLPDVTRVDIYKTDDEHLWDSCFAGNYPLSQPSSTGSKTLTIEENPELIFLLRESDNYSTIIPKPKQHKGYLVFCWAGHELDALPHPYVYIPETGQLGRRNEWCYVPNKFKDWMKKLANP